MSAGTYKNNISIMVTYQAVACATGKTIQMDVYDETHAKDNPQCGTMTEIGTTGRYYKSFTPDAEGEWIVLMKNTTDSNGEVVIVVPSLRSVPSKLNAETLKLMLSPTFSVLVFSTKVSILVVILLLNWFEE